MTRRFLVVEQHSDLHQVYRDADAFIAIGIHCDKEEPGGFYFAISTEDPNYYPDDDGVIGMTSALHPAHGGSLVQSELPAAVAKVVKQLLRKADIIWSGEGTAIRLR